MSAARLIMATALMTGVPVHEIRGRCKATPIARARFVAVWAIRQRNPAASFAVIGRLLGGRDHSTMIHAHRRAEELRGEDPNFRDLTDRVARMDGESISAMRRQLLDQARQWPMWIDRPGRRAPACAGLLVSIPLTDVAPVLLAHKIERCGGDPRLSAYEIARRAGETASARAAYERRLLEMERSRYGMTRQTCVPPVSEMAL